MRRLSTRRVLTWTVVPLLLAQIGCAARGVRVPAVSPQGAVTEADRKACEEYAKKQKTKSVVGLSLLGMGGMVVALPLAIAGLVILDPGGLMALAGAGATLNKAGANAKANQAAREAALQACLAPILLAQRLGPEHPEVAQSLHTLAMGYAAIGDLAKAEPYFRRALAIRETALGPEDPDAVHAVPTLEGYAALLRKMHREAEATDLETRAQVIRAKAEATRVTNAATASETRPEAADPSGPIPPTSPTPDPAE